MEYDVGSGRSAATALLFNVPVEVRLNHVAFYTAKGEK
jgi:hypothetical protein